MINLRHKKDSGYFLKKEVRGELERRFARTRGLFKHPLRTVRTVKTLKTVKKFYQKAN